MSLRFFDNTVNNNINPIPPVLYEELQQEFVNLQWSNTAVIETVKEQNGIGCDTYNDIDVWVDATIADTTTGLKDTFDFLKFIFKDINHSVKRGQMYQFDNNYWIVHSYTPYDGLVQSCGVRRCNNFLRMIDPLNGSLVKFPCIIDYDMSSPSAQTSKYIITPNNHAVVMVQGNDLSHRLLKTNTRFILGGRPFKLLAYQNAIEDDVVSPENTLMYLDLYLDEIHDKDDIIHGLAENGEFNYNIVINSSDMSLLPNDTGVLTTTVLLNGNQVEREIVWESSNKNIVKINSNGEYNIIGENGESAFIKAYIKGNDNLYDEIKISVVDSEPTFALPILKLNPTFDVIRQYENIIFNVSVEFKGITYTSFDSIQINLINNSSDFVELINSNGNYNLIANNISSEKCGFNVIINNNNPNFEINENIYFDVVSMLG